MHNLALPPEPIAQQRSQSLQRLRVRYRAREAEQAHEVAWDLLRRQSSSMSIPTIRRQNKIDLSQQIRGIYIPEANTSILSGKIRM